MSRPPGGGGLPPLPWDGFSRAEVTPLGSDELLERLQAADLIRARERAGAGSWRVEEHPRSGRNRIFRVQDPAGGRWLAKQCLTFPRAEARFYAGPATELDFALDALLVDADRELVVLPELGEFREALDPEEAVPLLAPVLARLHRIHQCSADPVPASARSPFPTMDPVDVRLWEDSTPAARELIRRVQSSPGLSDALRLAAESPGTTAFIHGDLKVDNVLLVQDQLRVVDWECSGIGPAEWDVGALIASWLLAASDRVAAVLAGTPALDGLTPAQVLEAGGSFLAAYRIAGGPRLAADILAASVAAWVVGRSWVQASFNPVALPPAVEFRLLLAEDVATHPERFRTPVQVPT